MTKPKHVPSTLMNILACPVMEAVMDRSSNCMDIVDAVNDYWEYDLYSRKPSPAQYDDTGKIIKSTDLDLATFLYALVDRGAIINLPEYKAKRAKTVKEGQMVVSEFNRHGKILGLTSNKNVFTFGVRILDQNVMTTEATGYPRTYLLTDFDGSWYDGWRCINFLPTASENKFISESRISDDNKISFDNFVTPEKWISFYGQYYFITKCAIDRLADELSKLKIVKDILFEKGFKLLPSAMEDEVVYPTWNAPTEKEAGTSIKVQAFEVEVDIPEYVGEYDTYPESDEAYTVVCSKIKKINRAIAKFRFATRCVEYAAWKHGFESFPAWFKNVSWEDYKTSPKSRTIWNRLTIVQPGVGQKSVSIRFRQYEKSEQVRAD